PGVSSPSCGLFSGMVAPGVNHRGTVWATVSIELELFPPVLVLLKRRLLLLVQQIGAENQIVHVGAHETAGRVLGGADDRLSADVERGIDDHRHPRALVELLD